VRVYGGVETPTLSLFNDSKYRFQLIMRMTFFNYTVNGNNGWVSCAGAGTFTSGCGLNAVNGGSSSGQNPHNPFHSNGVSGGGVNNGKIP